MAGDGGVVFLALSFLSHAIFTSRLSLSGGGKGGWKGAKTSIGLGLKGGFELAGGTYLAMAYC